MTKMTPRKADPEAWAASGLLYEVVDNVAWLRLNRPEKRNAINRPLRTALLEAIHEVSEDPDARVAVITGNGPVFCSGADLNQEGGPFDTPPDRWVDGPNGPRRDGAMYGWYRMVDALWHSETPFISAVNGVAAGAGCQLALGCDIVLAAEDAAFWEIFVRLGLPLEGGAAWLLTRSLSLVRAKELALFGDRLPAAKAEQWGLVNAVVPAADLIDTARDWASRLATVPPPGSGPGIDRQNRDLSQRVGHIKGQLNSAWEQTMWQTFREEFSLLGVHPGNRAAWSPNNE
ncbi:MAG: enoyl-CoA hydratase/isomerase family protein [Acidobacteria bacterium]|nr:enoyl-CoA hydratase/isomerase family protein [Acidobacteriota bacterium]